MIKKITRVGVLLSLASSLSFVLVGCEDETTEVIIDDKKESVIIADKELKSNASIKLSKEEAYLNGFPEQNLVEFNVVKEGKDSLRVFQVGDELTSFLSKQSQDGKTALTISYQESTDGISSPKLVEVMTK